MEAPNTMTTKALQTTQAEAYAADLETLRGAVGADLNNSQLKLAVVYAERVGADLFARQIYPIVDRGRLTFITSIDFLRVTAERSGRYAGQGRPDYEEGCDCQGEAQPLAMPHPRWAEVPIFREGWREPIIRRAYFHEYVVFQRDGQVKETWRKMPHVMIAKVSEAAGIRAAFPNDVQGLYTQDEMEQAGVESPPVQLEPVAQQAAEPEPAAEPELVVIEDNTIEAAEVPAEAPAPAPAPAPSPATIEIPDDEPKPEWGEHEVRVREAPDGVRTVKKPEWADGLDGSTVQKLEIKGKYGRRNITIIVLGPLAYAVDALSLAEGATFVVDGKKHEYEWQKGKPKALQVRHVTRLAVSEAGKWREATPEREPEPTPEPADTEDPKGAASSAEPTAPTSTSDPSGSSGADLTAAATDEFAEMLDGDVDPARGGNPNVGDKWEQLPVLDGPNEEAVHFEGYYAKGESTEVPGSPGRFMWDAWVTSISMDARYHVLMAEQVAESTGVDRLGPGEQVYVRGTWRHPKQQPVVLADTLRPA
jgi:phage recombination protein Bet